MQPTSGQRTRNVDPLGRPVMSWMLWAFRLEDSPSGHSLQVLAEGGSGLFASVPNAKHPQAQPHGSPHRPKFSGQR